MIKSKIFLILIFVLISSFLIYGCSQQRTETKQDASTAVTKTRVSLLDIEIKERNGQKYIVDPIKIETVLPRDAIPSILEPKFVKSEQEDFIDDEEYVLGVFVNEEAKAYPIKILNYHEIVNDNIGGIPVIATYCPLCGTGLSFIREVDGKLYTFGVSGKLYNSDLVMYDHQTNTYWTQALGLGIVGHLTKIKLVPILTDTIKWKDWKVKHPDTLILSTDTGFIRDYKRDPYSGYDQSSKIWFPVDIEDNRLFSKARVYGISVNNESKAYPKDILKEKKMLEDKVGGEQIMAKMEDDGTVRFFTKKGDKQDQIIADYLYWFAWVNFHPDTKLYS